MSSSVATRLQSIYKLLIVINQRYLKVDDWVTYRFEVQLFEDCVEESGCMTFSWHGLASSYGRHGVSGLRAMLCFSAQRSQIDCNSEFSVNNVEIKIWE